MSSVYELKSSQDLKNILASYRIVVINSHASWCTPCHVFRPKYEKIASVFSSKDIIFTRCDVELNLFPVKGIPSIEFYVEGALFKNITGADMNQLKETLSQVVPDFNQKWSRMEASAPVQNSKALETPKTMGNPIQGYTTKNQGRKGGYSNYKNYLK